MHAAATASAPAEGFDLPDQASMTVWPTIGATALGRLVGRLCGVTLGFGRVFTLGKLLAIASIPLALIAFFWQLRPWACLRYRVTSRRIVVLRAMRRQEIAWTALDAFDAVEIQVLPGQAWLQSGELVFLREGREVLRWSGVCRPEVLRRICLDARTTFISVRKVLAAQAAAPATLAAGSG
jgi:hypothetical protein